MKKVCWFFACTSLAVVAMAIPYATPVLDGAIMEYDAGDLQASFSGTPTWETATITNLYVTWDETSLYIAVQGWLQQNKIAILLDVDPDAAPPTGATTTTNWTAHPVGYIGYNDFGWVDASGTFGLDYMLSSEGFFNNLLLIDYDGDATPTTNNVVTLFDNGNGNTPLETPVDMAANFAADGNPQRGLEARIPWSVLYNETGRFGTVETAETVPRGARLRILAGIHNNDNTSAWSSDDTLPQQNPLHILDGILQANTYADVVIDEDQNGIPDGLAGDHAAPYIRAASGAVGGNAIYIAFNEAVTTASVETLSNWSIAGTVPSAAVAQGAQGVLLSIPSSLLTSTNFIPIRATGVEDPAGNSKTTDYYFSAAADGIPQALTVTFLVNTNSGMGRSTSHAKPSAFFLNGSILPLEWGYPPFENTPLTPVAGSNGWASTTITFPPGSPSTLVYKYSARLNGTNNYEAIRLADFTEAARRISLNTDGTPMTVREYLGAAAHPLRDPGNTNIMAHQLLYQDPQRGDAGVQVRREILFQLDLSLRDRSDLTRVFVAGSDPLRGFNDTGDASVEATDFPSTAYVSPDIAGVELFDDGTNGDAVAHDGIYSRVWSFSTNGIDSAIEPMTPFSLVGGHQANYMQGIPATEPYSGNGWTARRSPRSLIYKFYTVISSNTMLESPGYNLEYYMDAPEDPSGIVLPPFVWDNEGLPPPPPSNAPSMSGVTLSGSTATVEFENLPGEAAHGILVATNLLSGRDGFQNYGIRASRISTNEGVAQWAGTVQNAGAKEFYAAYAGPEPDPFPTYWEPSAIPLEATTWRVHFSQYKSNLAGSRSISFSGAVNNWGETPMTFLGNGHWVADIALPPAYAGTKLIYKFRSSDIWLEGADLLTVRGGPSTWMPDQPIPGDVFTVTLDAAGTPIAAAEAIHIHLGFDSGWYEAATRPMTNTGGSIWEYALPIPTNYTESVNWLFNASLDGETLYWYNPFGDWKAFFSTFVNPPEE
ncbi:MAG: hypothetical protein LBN38_03600 [Verrucomicrobiota bacterium]|nr:hypothetical protein [Verrucomicrobiota bacterium]